MSEPYPSRSSLFHIGRSLKALTSRYLLLAMVWAFFAQQTLLLTTQSTGAVCPANACWERTIPIAQLVMLGLDGLIIAQVARIRQRHSDGGQQSSSVWAFLSALCLSSAWVLASLLCFSNLFFPGLERFRWAPNFHRLFIHDLAFDSAFAAAVLLSAVSLLSILRPATVALIVGATNLYAHHFKRVVEDQMVLRASPSTGLMFFAEATFAGLSLWMLLRHESRFTEISGSGERLRSVPHSCLTIICTLSLFALGVVSLLSYARGTADLLDEVVVPAMVGSGAWITAASRTGSLPEAVEAYKSRYSIPPPPNFDKWFSFAVEQKSAIIDTFDQIHNDLLPFWGMSPALLRERTSHLLEQVGLGTGGFRIKGGEVVMSTHTPGTHFWMMEGFKAMVEPFLKWLPNMDLAFNLDDECRVIVPFDDLRGLIVDAHESMDRLAKAAKLQSFSQSQNPPWSDRYLEEDFEERNSGAVSPFFSFRTDVSIFDNFVAPTCSPEDPARTMRWWNRNNALPGGRGVVRHGKVFTDLCHRPDLAQVHGFLLDPGAFAVTRSLFPFFSQSRICGFNDILVPSPWNFISKVDVNESMDREWKDKFETVFWRGSLSDGLSTHGSWTGFLRARFVNLANTFSSSGWTLVPSPNAFTLSNLLSVPRGSTSPVNVSFVGNFSKCHPEDCKSETATFFGGPDGLPPPNVDFQEHWAYRHLVDLDGAGFSGRFLPFLKSKSVVYRATLFRTWYDERIHPWVHFVPLDISLPDVWAQVKWLGMQQVPSRIMGPPETTLAERVASEGREWALKVLRKEDMQVYMFRLLLEWGRLVDDRREELGYPS